uniref:Uncharacterized protein n=1 Tax=Steinernema glaseri TaxID=37863 RepID=A0A1I7ZRS0_9BILA
MSFFPNLLSPKNPRIPFGYCGTPPSLFTSCLRVPARLTGGLSISVRDQLFIRRVQVYREVHFFQFVTYAALFLLGLGHFFLSLKVAFVL